MTTLIYIMAIVGTIQTLIVGGAAAMLLYIVLKADDPKAEVVNANAA